ncbi:hypothetical protein NVIRPANT_00127 [Pantoea sp. Nvir]|nr:hypothetical protein NVIRPANT_00127 [Pantoea sp. Nvir]
MFSELKLIFYIDKMWSTLFGSPKKVGGLITVATRTSL